MAVDDLQHFTDRHSLRRSDSQFLDQIGRSFAHHDGAEDPAGFLFSRDLDKASFTAAGSAILSAILSDIVPKTCRFCKMEARFFIPRVQRRGPFVFLPRFLRTGLTFACIRAMLRLQKGSPARG